MAKQSSSSSQAAALISEEGLYEVPVLDWNTANKRKCPLPPRPPRPVLTAVLDRAVEQEIISNGDECDQNSDEYKTLRRTVSNRLAARNSRMKRRSIIAENITRSGELKVAIDSLRPQVEAFEEKKKLLEVENASLQEAFHARVNHSIIAAELTEKLRLEIAKLKENLAVLYLVQSQPQPQPQPEMQMQPYGIDINQQMPPVNAQPQMQPYGIDFYQKMPENAQPPQAPVFVEGGGGGDGELELYQYFNLDGGEGMNLGPI